METGKESKFRGKVRGLISPSYFSTIWDTLCQGHFCEAIVDVSTSYATLDSGSDWAEIK